MHARAAAFMALLSVGCSSGTAAPSSATVPSAAATEPASPWAPYAPSGLPLRGDSVIHHLVFVDDRTGFMAWSGGAAVTRDGGESFAPLLEDVSVSGFGLGSPSGAFLMGGVDQRLPALWSSEASSLEVRRVPTFDLKEPLSRFAFAHHTTDVVVAVSEVTGKLYLSESEGRHWTDAKLDRFKRVASVGGEIWAAGGAFPDRSARIAYTGNDGIEWSMNVLQSEISDGGPLWDIGVISATDLWVCGENRQLYRSGDGGRNWTQIKNLPSEVHDIYALHVARDHVLFAASGDGDYLLGESTDAGASFTIVDRFRRSNAAATWLSGIASPRPGVYIVYGTGATLHRYAR